MSKPAMFYKLEMFGKEKYQCEIIGSFLIWRIIRYPTVWDNSFTTYRTRIKFSWNVEELKN